MTNAVADLPAVAGAAAPAKFGVAAVAIVIDPEVGMQFGSLSLGGDSFDSSA